MFCNFENWKFFNSQHSALNRIDCIYLVILVDLGHRVDVNQHTFVLRWRWLRSDLLVSDHCFVLFSILKIDLWSKLIYALILSLALTLSPWELNLLNFPERMIKVTSSPSSTFPSINFKNGIRPRRISIRLSIKTFVSIWSGSDSFSTRRLIVRFVRGCIVRCCGCNEAMMEFCWSIFL